MMSLRDDATAWILRMFEMEEREGRGIDCQRFSAGQSSLDLPLEAGERVYGIYKQKYFFTPRSLIVRTSKQTDRIAWKDICSCSSTHGDGKKFADVLLTNGAAVRIRVGDLATGWSGRISQLFHQMIETHGAKAAFGPPLYSIEDFFAAADNEHCPWVNLEPHPTLGEIRESLVAIREMPGVAALWFSVAEIEAAGSPIADGVVIRTAMPPEAFSDFATRYRADGVIQAPDNIVRKVPDLHSGENLWLVVWD